MKQVRYLITGMLFCMMLIGVATPTMEVQGRDLTPWENEGRGIRDFENLRREIEGAAEGDTLYISVDREVPVSGGEIVINKPITVKFNSRLNRGSFLPGVQRLFNITSDNVTLDFGNVVLERPISRGQSAAIQISGNNVCIKGGTISNAECQSSGRDCAAIYIAGDNVTIDSVTFKDSVDRSIYIEGDNAKIDSCSFNSCSSKWYGGAICVMGKDAYIASCSFNDCKSNGDGGAIYVYPEVNSQRRATVYRCNFSNCSANGSGQWVCANQQNVLVLYSTQPYLDESIYRHVEYDYEELKGIRHKDTQEKYKEYIKEMERLKEGINNKETQEEYGENIEEIALRSEDINDNEIQEEYEENIEEVEPLSTGSTFSGGSLWIIIGLAAVVAIAVIVLVFAKKKQGKSK